MAEIIFAQDNRHQFKIDRGLIDTHTDKNPNQFNYRSRVDYMSQLKAFKIGLRPHEEFYFESNHPGGSQFYDAENDKENRHSPNFGGGNSRGHSKKSSMKNSKMGNSVVNMNNYVSSKNMNFNDVPKGFNNDDQVQMEEQFRSIQ
jgi:hypothetical protein